MKGGDFKEFGELYVGCEEFIDMLLFDGNHSDEFAEEEDTTPSLARTHSYSPHIHSIHELVDLDGLMRT